MMLDSKLDDFATERQLELMEAMRKHGTTRAAAIALGVHHSRVASAIVAVKKKAAMRGWSPEHDMTKVVPETHNAARISSHYTKGQLDQQWVIATLDEKRAQAAREEAWQALAETLPRAVPVPPPAHVMARLLNLYTLTDCHVGMLSWAKETGEPWDLKIAEETLVGCFELMVRRSPPARHAYVNQLGDFMHYDSMKAITPEHGHLLDSDGRFPKMAEVAVRILRRIVGFALERHEVVYVLAAEGNHDPAASVWLRIMLKALYENEPRVQVVGSEFPYYAHQHGETMLAFHHGHLKKNATLPELFASVYAKLWGATTRRYCHTGHRHHTEEREHSGMIVFQHPTLAAKDAYAARGGWEALRQATAITYHDRSGEVQRTTVNPQMLEP